MARPKENNIPGFPIRIIFPQQVEKKIGHIGDGLHAEKDESHLTFEGFKFITKYNSHSGLPVCNYVNGISTFKAYNIDIYQDGGKTDNFTLAQRSLLKCHRKLGHMNFRSVIRFTRLGLIPFILTTIREEDIPIFSSCCFGKQSCTYPNTYGSGEVIADEHDQPGMCISINQIKSTLGGLIPVLKENQTSRKYHVATIFGNHSSKLVYLHFSEITKSN